VRRQGDDEEVVGDGEECHGKSVMGNIDEEGYCRMKVWTRKKGRGRRRIKGGKVEEMRLHTVFHQHIR